MLCIYVVLLLFLYICNNYSKFTKLDMKHFFSALSILLLAACGPQNPTTTPPPTADSAAKPAQPAAPAPDLTGEINQDSLRSAILKSKENTILKASFLQEFYIRDIVRAANDSVYFDIPFDLHAIDCGAPDCYVTQVKFAIKLGNDLVFPPNIKYNSREHGCVDREYVEAGDFQLVERNSELVIYHDAKLKNTLVLFNSNKETGTFAYYFSDVNVKQVTSKNVYEIIDVYLKSDEKAIFPLRSTYLNTFEYQRFVK